MAIVNTVEALEQLTDAESLTHVLTGLEIMCGEKAEHIKVNWQDAKTARVWNRASKLIGTLARQIDRELKI
jgi:hypothetical protein